MSELIIGRPGRGEEVAPTALLTAFGDGGFYIAATPIPRVATPWCERQRRRVT